MNKIFLAFEDDAFDSLLSHLLPAGDRLEQAAFLFATLQKEQESTRFQVIGVECMQPSDFEVQHEYYLELRDVSRARVIQRAHDLGASLIEVHSHPGGLPAAFSPSDLNGLRDTVPNMLWRLKKHPYMALVVANGGFDALVWLESADSAQALTQLLAGKRVLRPTNTSLRYW